MGWNPVQNCTLQGLYSEPWTFGLWIWGGQVTGLNRGAEVGGRRLVHPPRHGDAELRLLDLLRANGVVGGRSAAANSDRRSLQGPL